MRHSDIPSVVKLLTRTGKRRNNRKSLPRNLLYSNMNKRIDLPVLLLSPFGPSRSSKVVGRHGEGQLQPVLAVVPGGRQVAHVGLVRLQGQDQE